METRRAANTFEKSDMCQIMLCRENKQRQNQCFKWGKIKWMLRNAMVFLLVFMSLPQTKAEIRTQLIYPHMEESGGNFFIGNISHDALFESVYTASQISSLIFTIRGSTGGNQNLFMISNPYGILSTRQSIDRDTICDAVEACEISFNVLTQPLFEIIRVTVAVSDENDNTPRFPRETVTISIPESTSPGPVYSLSTAVDTDSLVNSVQQYDINPPSDMFALQLTENSGIISHISLNLLQHLDRERQSFYRIRVIASDGGIPPLSGSVWVNITVTDTNDNNPTFDRVEYVVNVPENTPANTVIQKVTAYDPDEGESGRVLYSWGRETQEDYSALFGIRDSSGEIYLKRAMDYETGSHYQLTVLARDNGPDSLPSYAEVIVNVVDLNDHTPIITINSLSESGHAEVMENLRVGSFVAHAVISDPDAGENGNVQCYIDNDNFYVSYINQNMLTILTNRVFDREVLDNYDILLTCRDNGSPSLEAAEEIYVTVTDDNDHDPYFLQTLYMVNIHENNPIGASLATIHADDEDIGRNGAILYHINETEYLDMLNLDAISGLVTAKVSFDYEDVRDYEVLLVGHDQGDYMFRTATTTLSIHVLDANDHVPEFTNRSYHYFVRENETVGHLLGHLTAIDIDMEPYNYVTYIWDPTILDPIPFSLDRSSGEVSILTELNRETHSEYHLTAIALNNGYNNMESLVDVTVSVLDVNDNAPIIAFPSVYNNTIQVYVGTEMNTVVTRVSAYDLDEGPNGQLTFSMSNSNNTFRINPENGNVEVMNDLHELTSDMVKLHVKVTDRGLPPRSTETDLNVIIQLTLMTSSESSSHHFFKGPNLIIIIVIVGFVIVLIVIIGMVMTLRRKRTHVKENKKLEYPLRAMEVESGDNSDSSQNLDDDFDEKPYDEPDGSTPNGHTDGVCERPKKEVKFVLDLGGMGGIGDSSTDDYHVLWPSRMPKPDTEAGRIRPQGFESNPGHPHHPAPLPNTDPMWAKNWDYSPYGRLSPRKPVLLKGPSPVRGSPTTLTERELEMHEMMQMMGQEDSETGSVTDSGRGPSEEGDTRPSPVDPATGDERGGAINGHKLPLPHHKVASAQPRISHNPGGPGNKQYCYPDHRNPIGPNPINCPLKPNRTFDPRVASTSKIAPLRRSNMANISTDSNDSAVSSLSWAGGSSFDGSVKGGHPNDRKVTFQEEGRGRTYLLPQSVPERPARGPLAKFSYVGHNKTAPTQQYAPMPYGGNGNPGEQRTYSSLPNIQHMPINSYQGDSGLSDEDCNGNQGNKLKGILKNADEPILRCIQENLERYEEDPPSWVRDNEGTDLTSEDGSVTTMSGSYVLDPSEKQAKLSPRHGFSV